MFENRVHKNNNASKLHNRDVEVAIQPPVYLPQGSKVHASCQIDIDSETRTQPLRLTQADSGQTV